MNEEPIKAVDNRRPDGTFGPGNLANPAGRPKGQSLKEYWKQRLSDMTPQEKEDFARKVAADVIWKMAEGMPSQDSKMEHSGTVTVELSETIANKNSNDTSRDTESDSSGQTPV